jgi:DMSO/TMAO reductase YedYZ molybdopterin-dependent catalytic subunit
MRTDLSRRGLLAGGAAAGLGGLLLSGCDRLNAAPEFRSFLGSAEGLTMRSQRLLLSGQPLAREFERRHISDVFKPNGSTDPQSPEYLRLVADDFQSWRLRVDGLVANPLSLSLGQLRTLPSRTQITRHDCVEGWSAIGEWKGVPLRVLLQSAGLQPEARYIVFHCADNYRNHTGPNERYYESIDLFDAFHPQTILAYDFNGGTLPVAYGAPVRLRVERQLGYKQAKYVMRVQAVNSLAGIGMGKGGYWEDHAGYQWYAGI